MKIIKIIIMSCCVLYLPAFSVPPTLSLSLPFLLPSSMCFLCPSFSSSSYSSPLPPDVNFFFSRWLSNYFHFRVLLLLFIPMPPVFLQSKTITRRNHKHNKFKLLLFPLPFFFKKKKLYFNSLEKEIISSFPVRFLSSA